MSGPEDRARVWRRAAVYGSLWAAVEIVVGSFLHNVRFPLAGTVLSAIGVVLLTVGHRSAPERGLIWRAALICSLMKSISPSAVILGPMIGILMEGLLLEAMVRLVRGRAIGYLAGGALAVAWALAQRLLNALITFGPDLVRLYADAYHFAARSLGVTSFGPFDLIAALLALELGLGCLAAALGLSIGRAGAGAASVLQPASAGGMPQLAPPTVAQGDWSLARLAIFAAALVAGMFGLGRLPLWAAALGVAAYATGVLLVYPRAAGRLRRISLWIELLAVILLAGLVFGGLRHGMAGLLDGAASGVTMALRATMVLLGFTAISVELRNPVILAWLEERRLQGLSDALGVAFGALPTFTAALAEHRHLWRRPRLLAATLLEIADRVHYSAAPPPGGRGAVVLISGPTGAGKTTLATAVVAQLRGRGVRVAGILAPGLLDDGRRTGFDILDLATGEQAPLAREQQPGAATHVRWSRFAFTAEGLSLGARALGEGAVAADVVVVDEVGPLELAGGGWAASLDALAARPAALLLIVRDAIVADVTARWGSAATAVYDVASATPAEIADALIEGMGIAGAEP